MNDYNRYLKEYYWIIILPIILVIYTNRFNHFNTAGQEHSILAEADSANYIILIKDFHLKNTVTNLIQKAEASMILHKSI